MWECWSWIAALAAATGHIALGTYVCANAQRNPALLAKMAETVDEISGGRLTLGLGSGGGEPSIAPSASTGSSRFGRFEEGIQIVRELLPSGHSNYPGTWYAIEDVRAAATRAASRRLADRGRYGRRGPRMLGAAAQRRRRVERLAALDRGKRPGTHPALRAAADEACRQVGRDPASLRRSAGIGISLGGSPVAFGTWDLTDAGDRRSPEQIAEGLRGFAAEGIDQVQVSSVPRPSPVSRRSPRCLEVLDRP